MAKANRTPWQHMLYRMKKNPNGKIRRNSYHAIGGLISTLYKLKAVNNYFIRPYNWSHNRLDLKTIFIMKKK